MVYGKQLIWNIIVLAVPGFWKVHRCATFFGWNTNCISLISHGYTNEHLKVVVQSETVVNSWNKIWGQKFKNNLHISQFNRLKLMILRIMRLLNRYKGLSLVHYLLLLDFSNWSMVKEEFLKNKLVTLKKTLTVHSKSRLIGRLAFHDSDVIMRDTGGLGEADVEQLTKHAIILHSWHWSVRLFALEMHKRWQLEWVGLREALSNNSFGNLFWDISCDPWKLTVCSEKSWHDQ